jgi:hypothetical protein
MLRFKHSGNAGDVIYALPAIRALCNNAQTQAHVFLQTDQPNILYPGATHPLGAVRLNTAMLRALTPLIEYQSYVSEVTQYQNEDLDYDLDKFRELPLNPTCGSIPRWYLALLNTGCNLAEPWLEARRRKEFTRHIVMARSSRYRNPNLNFSFLRMYPNVIFVGVEEEYHELRASLPNLGYYAVEDFLELADIIKSCRVFIGNQSLPFAIAEGLKAPRILEPCLFAGNVIPTGENAYDAYTQDQLERLVHNLAKGF